MKKFILLALPVITICACSSDEPQMSGDPGRSYSRPRKAPPSVSSRRAEDFRAIERPATYSE
jgi:uncharacterized lipoprotein